MKKKKKIIDPFKELVKAMQKREDNKRKYPETMGRGQVKGQDVASMREILDSKK